MWLCLNWGILQKGFTKKDMLREVYGCFERLGVMFVGVLTISSLRVGDLIFGSSHVRLPIRTSFVA